MSTQLETDQENNKSYGQASNGFCPHKLNDLFEKSIIVDNKNKDGLSDVKLKEYLLAYEEITKYF